MPTLTIVIPAYNESSVLDAFYQRLGAVLDGLSLETQMLFVDDGSSDDTWQVITGLCVDPRVRALRL
jgi:glycosyltransferase involved in cell wall biosynthesis